MIYRATAHILNSTQPPIVRVTSTKAVALGRAAQVLAKHLSPGRAITEGSTKPIEGCKVYFEVEQLPLTIREWREQERHRITDDCGSPHCTPCKIRREKVQA
jgi:hypothetical protein